MILHITRQSDWEAAQKRGYYETEGLPIEGFIHCSTLFQVLQVANFLFRGQKGLVLLEIDESRVKAEIRYEGETEEKFPHIYGRLNLDAVICVHNFEPRQDGSFRLPAVLLN